MDLADFLLARIAEDEAEVAKLDGWSYDEDGLSWWGEYAHLSISPARVLAECEAKRRLVEVHEKGREAYPGCTIEDDPCCMECSAGGEYPSGWPCRTLAALIAVYADHPDYRSEWARVTT